MSDEGRGQITQDPVDTLVAVGGRRLALRQAGAGSPTVVLEGGVGCGKETWDRVLGPVATFTRVCSYDRAGIGASDPAPTPRTGREAAADLHALLVGAAVPGPYVLVGHSGGGLFIRLYAHEHREQLAGMVLVDATHEEQWSRSLRSLPPETPGEPEGLTIYRRVATERITDSAATTAESFLTGATSAQVRATAPLGDLPLVVLTAAKPAPRPAEVIDDPKAHAEALWREMRQAVRWELVRLSSRGRHVAARASGHFIQQEEPELVIAAIRQVVEEARRKR